MVTTAHQSHRDGAEHTTPHPCLAPATVDPILG